MSETITEWAISRWKEEVQNRPLNNVYRPALDSVWRQVIRYEGGDDRILLGPTHQELVGQQPELKGKT